MFTTKSYLNGINFKIWTNGLILYTAAHRPQHWKISFRSRTFCSLDSSTKHVICFFAYCNIGLSLQISFLTAIKSLEHLFFYHLLKQCSSDTDTNIDTDTDTRHWQFNGTWDKTDFEAIFSQAAARRVCDRAQQINRRLRQQNTAENFSVQHQQRTTE